MYEMADQEVMNIASQLIEQHHRHLLNANLSYLFRDRPWKTAGDGRTVLGKAARRNEIDKLLSQRREDFVIIIAKPRWDIMPIEERRCLIDHELCHCGAQVDTSGNRKWILRRHAIEEFPENLARFEPRRQLLGNLIAQPPSAVITKPSSLRRIRSEGQHEEEGAGVVHPDAAT